MTTKPKRPRRVQKRKKKFIVPWLKTSPHDWFEIHPSLIPNGSSYQWCCWEVAGKPEDQTQKQWLRGGWTHVPASRHPGAPKDHRDRICHGGQMLMERPLELTRTAQDKEYGKAEKQFRAFQEAYGITTRGEGAGCPLTQMDSLRKEAPPAPKPDKRPIQPTVVTANIKIMLTAREVEIACACCMTNERYAQNKLALLLQQAFDPEACAALMPSKNGTFAFAGLKFQVATE